MSWHIPLMGKPTWGSLATVRLRESSAQSARDTFLSFPLFPTQSPESLSGRDPGRDTSPLAPQLHPGPAAFSHGPSHRWGPKMTPPSWRSLQCPLRSRFSPGRAGGTWPGRDARRREGKGQQRPDRTTAP